MYKKIFMVALLCTGLSVSEAQNIEKVLADIERNNPVLRAQQTLVAARRAEVRSENTLENPEAELIRSWARHSPDKVLEINVTQGFDFPSAYTARRRAARIKEQQWGHEYNAARQSLLLDGKKLCLDIIALRQERRLLALRTDHAARLLDALALACEKGEATVLDKNRAETEWIDVRTALDLKTVELRTAEERLAGLNGGEPVQFPDTLFPAQEPLPPLEAMMREYAARAPELAALLCEQQAAEADLRVSRSEALPGFKVGYHFEKSADEKLNGLIAGISIPLWSGRRQIKSSKAQIDYARSSMESCRADMETLLRERYARYEILLPAVERLRVVARRQEEMRRYIADAYRMGSLNEDEYLTELGALYAVEEQLIAAEHELHTVIAEIDALNL